MIFFVIFCVVLQSTLSHNARTTHKMVATATPKLDRNVYKKTAELIYYINEIYNNDEDKLKEVENYVNSHNNREMALKQIMKLIQKNYDASKLHKEKPKVRVHFISNPEVLERFKDVLNEEESSSYDNESADGRKLKEILRSLRRQAVFRIDDPESEEKTVLDEQNNAEVIQNSVEDNVKAELMNEKNIHNSRKKEDSKENKDNNAWDVITKKYDWDKDNFDAKDNKDWGGKGGNISDEKESKKDNLGKDKKDTWDDKKDKKDKIEGLKKKNIYKLDEWGQKDKKDAWDDEEKDKRKDNWGNWGQKKDKKVSKWDDVGNDKRKDNWDDWGQKNDKKDSKWDAGKVKTKDSWDDWGQKKETLKTWGDKSKKKVEIKWEQPKIKKKGSDAKDKKNDWDTKWEKKDNWDNWDATTRHKRKTTKRKNQSFKKINEWEHYIPKVQSKPKRHEFERNIPAGAFGRTSIPFVGKKGIYEDK